MTTNEPINWDTCTSRRVDKRFRPLTVARLNRTIKKFKALQEKTKLHCGCTPYLRADGHFFLFTVKECREHGED